MAGLHDPPLSEKGQREALIAARYFDKIDLHAAYSSPLQRALETAKPILVGRRVEIRLEPDIRELDMGKFSGRSWREVVDEFPSVMGSGTPSFWQLFSQDLIPGQERYEVAAARIMDFFRRVTHEHQGENVLVVGHKGVLEVFLSRTLGFDPAIEFFEIGAASITSFRMLHGDRTKFLSINLNSNV